MALVKRKKQNPEFKICKAALHIIARQGWNRLTLDAVARAAKVPASAVNKLFADKNDLLPAIVGMIDAQMMASLSEPDSQATPHDRLFEILMARIDLLQMNRRAFIEIMSAAKRDPRMIRKLLPAQAKAMSNILNFADLKPDTICEPFVISGLLGVYSFALLTWRKDSSPDMSKTMAALDRYLRRATVVSEILFRRKSL